MKVIILVVMILLSIVGVDVYRHQHGKACITYYDKTGQKALFKTCK